MILLAAAIHVAAEEALPQTWRVYVGTYTGGGSEGIYLADMNAETGALTLKGLAAATENPAFLAAHPAKAVIYAVGEMGGEGGTISAFSVDAATGMLTLLNRQSSGGGGPCHVAVSPQGNAVAVANYGGGSVSVLPVQEDGSLGAAHSFFQHAGSSVNAQRQEGPHAHAVNFDGPGRFLYVADLGLDQVKIYRFDGARGTIAENAPDHGQVTAGSGPRHVALEAAGRFAYVVNEMGSTVTVFSIAKNTGALAEVQSIGTLPADFTGDSTTAEIVLHPTGKYLYVSNRGHDSIAGYAVDAKSGKLTLIGHTPAGGKTPRNFNIDPAGKFLLAANQESGNVVVFAVDAGTGALSATGSSIAVDKPVCVIFTR
ncbi:MAG: lactonase family protein [Candidatus Hydrogenedentes bacterium]|nr:lactonase family protein [Candidatus Hydrogenedentota bacterium]